jgi:hypothetical protein
MTNAEMGGQERISQVRLRSPWQVGKLTAFRSSLPRRSYHRSSDLKTNYPRKFSQSQGKYIGVYNPPLSYYLTCSWLVACCLFRFVMHLETACCAMFYLAPIGGQPPYESFNRIFCDRPYVTPMTDHVFDKSEVTKTSARGRGTVNCSKVSQRPKSSTPGAPGRIAQGQTKTKDLHARGTGTHSPRSDKDQSPPRQGQWIDYRPQVDHRPKSSVRGTGGSTMLSFRNIMTKCFVL